MESSYLSGGHFMESDGDGVDHNYAFNDSNDESQSTKSTRDIVECAFCDQAFSSRKRLRAHKSDHYKNKTFSCKRCPAHFTSYQGWLFHFKKHRSDLQYSCHICGAKYCSFQQLVRHTEAHEYRKESKFICNLCLKAFSLQYELLAHEREVHNITDNYGNESRILDVYSCTKCYQAFQKLSQYRNHLEKSSSCKPYRCQKCGKGFLSRIQFQSHTSNYYNCHDMSEKLLRKKFGVKIPNICIPRVETIVRCNRSAVTGEYKVETIVRSNRPAADENRSETIVRFNRLGTDEYKVETIVRSNRPATGENSAETIVRFNRPATGGSKIRPVKKHKSFSCNKCDRVFNKIRHRRDHWIRNKNCRPYWCNDCDAKFVSKERLEIHVRIHTYKCQTCFRRFKLRNEFEHHCCKNPSRMYESGHLAYARTDRKIYNWTDYVDVKQMNFTFVCQSCCKTYSTEKELQRHIDYVSERLFLCPKCSKTLVFKNKCTFRYHMMTTHEVD
ncbi:zinc finger protein 184-like [Planococcus citri]|uniref:zinc finger protein 184-like n=1 Tax=Planococcus citri TaxID=170843 RepID=UPI0031F73DA6